MKNNIFGYIFILFIIVIMGFAVYRVKVQNSKKENEISISTTSSEDIDKGTELVLAISEFDTINPIITSNKKVQDIDKIIYEPLVNITEDFNTEYILASECALTSNNTYVLRLKQGVRWSDGSKFTSDDVKYTIDILKNENSKSVYSQNVRYIQEVDIIDNYTLKIILSQNVQNFIYYLNFPILSSAFYGEDNFWNTEKNKAPITTGEFKISEVTNNTIVLEKNDKWWNKEKKSNLKKVTVNLYSTVAELYNAFKMGTVDLITTENALYQNYIGSIGYDLTEVEGREFIFLALNTNKPILSDINIRKALRSAIDKNQVIDNSYGNMYKVANFPLNPQSYLIEEEEENFYNTEEKNELLLESGWQLKNGVWQRTVNYRTNILELNLVVRAEDQLRCKAAENIKNQLLEQGIIVNIIYANDPEYDKYLNNISYDMLLGSINQAIAPDLSTYFGNNNLANYSNEEIIDTMNHISNISDKEELKNKYQRMYTLYNEEIPYIGIARNKILVSKNTNVVGEVKANWYNLFYNIDEWYVTK